MIAFRRVSKAFGSRPVVAGIDLAVEPGETLVLLGPSGCGKTTLLRMVNRLLEPDSGEVCLGGEPVRTRERHALRRSIGYMIQSGGLFPHQTVAQNILTVPRLLGWSEARCRDRVAELLRLVGLDAGFAERRPGSLSGGQRQRVGLARALAADPPVLLMDEPFSALDPVTRHEIRCEFLRLESLVRKTILLVTHDLEEAVLLGDRIALLGEGRLQQLGSARELLFQPASPFVEAFFQGERSRLEPAVVRLRDLGFPAEGLDPDASVRSALDRLAVTDAAAAVRLFGAYLAHRAAARGPDAAKEAP